MLLATMNLRMTKFLENFGINFRTSKLIVSYTSLRVRPITARCHARGEKDKRQKNVNRERERERDKGNKEDEREGVRK